ncbi:MULTISPECIES: metalloregulator ArsR/SmtB family transcription factor [unclassified Pseudodesulfovibrio]|uniref:ArsR/SmtB family transcription factor n=1 Tax=unclassified Pseudodesulfovibrio TaxID=2661612 RepID=UPI000FEB5D4F|nr:MULTISPECIES: metalloregulator ArsR/SmtB family transcription factor [unclassified Pseudodesulfovibrio]MCJ2163499.1 metalloregulator ArsR/SmtB family transcription factor [Pseudodesulfovibrio sp. S3-i]RWU06735.1 ArsR family transcriptional regulator [Pseudodesulfovibrio sp. S3]
MEHLALRFKGLSDPTRLRIFRLLAHGELCVCDLMAGLDLPQSTVSRHMSFLKKSDWVSSRRNGKWVYYTLTAPADEIQSLILQQLRRNLPAMKEARQDYGRLMSHLDTKNTETCTD